MKFCLLFLYKIFFLQNHRPIYTKTVQAASLVYLRQTAASILNNNEPTCKHDSPNLAKNEQKLIK